jgi:magnesium-protoporphyrin IX monomethyl ester (oxidative) cyclase
MRTDPKLTQSFANKLWIRFFLTAVYSTMYVRDHARPEFHKALGVDIEWYDQEVFRKTSTIARQVFPVELDIDHKRWLPNLRRMRDAFGLMDEGKKQGGLAGWIKAKRGAVIAAATFVALYTIPVIHREPPKNVRLEPAY